MANKIESKTRHEQQTGVKKKGLAIASLICGIIGGYASTVSIFAIIFGHVAVIKIKKNPNKYAGRKMAIAGLILGYLGLIIAMALGIMRGILKIKLGKLGY